MKFKNYNTYKCHIFRKHSKLNENRLKLSTAIQTKDNNETPENIYSFDEFEKEVFNDMTVLNDPKSNSVVKIFAELLLLLKSKHSISDQVLISIVERVQTVLFYVHDIFKNIVMNMDMNSLTSNEILQKFNNLKNDELDLKPLSTKYRWEKYFSENFSYVFPIEIDVGVSKGNVPLVVHYIPIIQNLRKLLENMKE